MCPSITVGENYFEVMSEIAANVNSLVFSRYSWNMTGTRFSCQKEKTELSGIKNKDVYTEKDLIPTVKCFFFQMP